MKSVIVPIKTEAKRLNLDVKRLSGAQQVALDMQLPFAVVFCFYKFDAWSQKDYVKLYNDLLSIESELAPRNIRLVVMVGSPDEKLPKLYSHIEPQIESLGSPGDLEKHPYNWTGIWYSVEYLRPRLEKEIGYNLA